MNETFKKTGFYPADILLPANADMTKWSVVACDQFTSQPEYWEDADRIVAEAPSTLRMILPEAGLNKPDVDKTISKINTTMKAYLEENLFETYEESLFYIERTQSDGKIRRGIIGMIDLECYDFTPGSGALIRATEGTVLSRIPPRVRVRKDAPVEFPHIMLLIDDPEKTVIEPLTAQTDTMVPVYDFDLMKNGGHLRGFRLSSAQTDNIAEALCRLTAPEEMERKYGMKDAAPLLFAVGDGNHSLATAKQCYEDLKKNTPEEKWMQLPARYALVEVVNNHDDALQFEPIHRVVFNCDPEKLIEAFKSAFPGTYEGCGEGHVIAYTYAGHKGSLTVPHPGMQLAVGTLQSFLDKYGKENGCEIDYIHGDDVTDELGSRPGNIGFKLPAMEKEQLFKTVMADGVLPRKTFSMGHAQDKRYYTEGRKIR